MLAERGQTYFDGLKMGKNQKRFMIFLIMGTLFEQMDLYLFAMLAPPIMKLWNLTLNQVGQIHASFAIGAVLGTLFFGWFADKKGRKIGMGTALLIGGFGSICSGLAPNFEILIFARVLCGFAITGGAVIEPNFLVEMVPSDKRSRYQSILGLIALIGIPLSTMIGKHLLSINLENWRYVAAIPSFSLLIGVLFLIFVHESPRWLITNNKLEEGKREFKKITGQELKIDPNFQCIVDKVNFSQALKIMFSKAYVKRTILFMMIFMFVNNAGFMFVQWFPTLLTKEGMELSLVLKYQQWVTMAMIFAPIYGMLFGDKGGRKYPYAIALSFIAIGLFGISFSGLANKGLLISFLLLVGAFYFTNNGFIGIYSSECYPTRVRATIYALLLMTQKVVNIFTNNYVAPNLYKTVGFEGYFQVLAAVYVAIILLILWLGPKTSGKSLEELTV